MNGIAKEIWEKSYPESKYKTLVLVDSEVFWLEDIKTQGFTGDTDVAIVEAFLAKREEEREKAEKEAELQCEKETSASEIIEELKKENETLKDRVDTLSTTVEELVLTTLE
ncbi:hypothetical protein [Peptostreptococcus porci]|nr:hypothetical protein [Peptostreptococcus porci]